jgi:hypothetical protein
MGFSPSYSIGILSILGDLMFFNLEFFLPYEFV